MMTETLVVPVDGSEFAERAFPVARALASQLDADIEAVTGRWVDRNPEAQRYLHDVAQRFAPIEIEFLPEREPAEAIEEVVNKPGEHLVCMTSHGRGAFRWAVLGSVAERVVHATRGPVVLVGRHCATKLPAGFLTAIVCVDGFDVAEPVVTVATEWAKELELDVHVVMVIHPLDVEGATVPDKNVEAIVEHFEAAGVRARSVVLRSRLVANAIADFAGTIDGSLVMMSSHSRTGVARVALGSVAMNTVGLSPSPVLVVPQHAR
jgi:nucleotide-binding universal stress UspA family protein